MPNYRLRRGRLQKKRPLIEHDTPKEPTGNSSKPRDSTWKEARTGKEPVKGFTMPGNPNFSITKQGMRAELEKIIRGEGLPICKDTRTVQEGDMKGFPIRRTCSDRKLGDDDSKDLFRWNQKMNRLFFVNSSRL